MKLDTLIDIKSLNEPLGWMGHLPFAKFIIETLRPAVFVELGTHTGNSYFAFCQSAVECGLNGSFHAVDTWRGDEHSELYGDEVFAMVQAHNSAYYSQISTLKRMTFDEALNDFSDASINLLHIDGFHTYEAVSHDFSTWAPKVKPDGVVLFHDICEKTKDFGVWRFWEELKQRYPTMEFHHSHGLGVLFMSDGTQEKVRQAIDSLVKNNFHSSLFFELASLMIFEKHTSQKKTDQINALAHENHTRMLENQNQILENQNLIRVNESISAQFDQKALEAQTYLSNYQAVIDSTSWKLTAPLRRALGYWNRAVNAWHPILRLINNRSIFSVSLNTAKMIKQMGLMGFLRAMDQRIYGAEKIENEYQKWIRDYDEFYGIRKSAICTACDNLKNQPLLSVLLISRNPAIDYLCKAIDSVMDQVYGNWELCIADDRSTDPMVWKTLEAYSRKDQRIKIILREENGSVSECGNAALTLVRGEYTALMDQEDILHPEALYWVARQINETPEAALIYTDEDKQDGKGIRRDPHFKPDFNYELFLSYNYIGRLGVYKTAVMKDLKGFRKGFENAWDWDLALRVLDKCGPEKIHHIPRILYHRRISKHSEANGIQAGPHAEKEQINALKEHLNRSGLQLLDPCVVKTPYGLRVNFPVPSPRPLVSIIIPTKNGFDLLKNCIDSIIQKTDYDHYEILIIDNGSDEEKTIQYLADLKKTHKHIDIYRDEGKFNFSALNNRAAHLADGEYLCLLNNDITVITPQWLDEMVSLACRQDTGAVGAKLYYPNNTVQHAGVILGIRGVAGHILKGLDKSDPGYFNRAVLRQELSCVTAACLVIKKEIFLQVGGFDEENLAVAFNDVDLCLKIQQQGYRNIWTPYAEFYHHESATRGFEDNPAKQARFSKEVIFMTEKWKGHLTSDPFFNPNLSLDVENYALSFPPRSERVQEQKN